MMRLSGDFALAVIRAGTIAVRHLVAPVIVTFKRRTVTSGDRSAAGAVAPSPANSHSLRVLSSLGRFVLLAAEFRNEFEQIHTVGTRLLLEPFASYLSAVTGAGNILLNEFLSYISLYISARIRVTVAHPKSSTFAGCLPRLHCQDCTRCNTDRRKPMGVYNNLLESL
jgi:hypothetical protein